MRRYRCRSAPTGQQRWSAVAGRPHSHTQFDPSCGSSRTSGATTATCEALERLGHRVERWPERKYLAGSVCTIRSDLRTGVKRAGADPRGRRTRWGGSSSGSCVIGGCAVHLRRRHDDLLSEHEGPSRSFAGRPKALCFDRTHLSRRRSAAPASQVPFAWAANGLARRLATVAWFEVTGQSRLASAHRQVQWGRHRARGHRDANARRDRD
jgi:hypothetical protein